MFAGVSKVEEVSCVREIVQWMLVALARLE